MHRNTPLTTAFVSYTAGGARATVDKMDDSQQMQQMSGSFMKFESREGVESPQNYGFTSHNFGAEKGQDGKVQGCAETFISFMGGNRSFPVAGAIDDRRHRLKDLKEGDTAMFRGRGDKQQFHMSEDGGFWSGPQNKTLRMALVESDSESNGTMSQGGQGGGSSSSGGGGATATRDVLSIASPGTLADSGGGGSSGGSSGGAGGGQQKRGQKSVKDDNTKSQRFMHLTKDETACAGNNVRFYVGQASSGGGSSGGGGGSLRAGSSSGGGSSSQPTGLAECNQDKNMYCGALKGKGQFALVVTLKGPSKNVYGKIG